MPILLNPVLFPHRGMAAVPQRYPRVDDYDSGTEYLEAWVGETDIKIELSVSTTPQKHHHLP